MTATLDVDIRLAELICYQEISFIFGMDNERNATYEMSMDVAVVSYDSQARQSTL